MIATISSRAWIARGWQCGRHTRALTSPPVSMQRDVEALAYDVGSQSIMVAGIGGRIGKQSRDIQIFDGASMTLLAKIDVTDRFKTVSGLWIDGRGRMRMIDQFGDEGSWPLRVSDLVGELESRAVACRVDRAFAKAVREADEALARNDVATAKDRLRQAATTRDDVSGPWVRLANLLYEPVKGTEITTPRRLPTTGRSRRRLSTSWRGSGADVFASSRGTTKRRKPISWRRCICR